jgi:hypothetical protein
VDLQNTNELSSSITSTSKSFQTYFPSTVSRRLDFRLKALHQIFRFIKFFMLIGELSLIEYLFCRKVSGTVNFGLKDYVVVDF